MEDITKKILLIITSTLFPQSKVNINSLKGYGGKAYKVDDDRPYTGNVFDLNKRTGIKKLEGQYINGLKNEKWSKRGNGELLGRYGKNRACSE